LNINSQDFKKNIVNGLSWTLFLKIVSIIIQFGTLGILARLLNPSDFGLMSILTISVGLSKIFSEFGYGAAIIQDSKSSKKDFESILSLTLVVSSLIVVLTFVFSGYISDFFKDERLEFALKLISITFCIDAFTVVQNAIAQKNLNFKFIALVQILSTVIGSSLCAIILAILDYGYLSLVFGYIITSFISFLAFNIKYGFIIPSFSFNSVKNYWSYGSYFTLGRIFNYFASQVDFFLVGKFINSSQLGYYSRSFQIVGAPANLIGGVIQKVMFPAFSQIKTDKKRIAFYYLTANKILAYFGLFITIFLFIYSNDIVNIFLGPKWVDSVLPLKILSIGLFFRLGYKTTTPIMNSLGLVKTRTIVEVVYFLLVTSFSLSFISYGISGVSIAILISLMFNFIVSNYLTCKALNITVVKFLFNYKNPLIFNLIILIISLSIKFHQTYLTLLFFTILFFYYKNIIKFINSEIKIIKS